MENGQSAASSGAAGAGEAATGQPPEEWIRRVADEVYRLLLHDLKLERERRGVYGGVSPLAPRPSPHFRIRKR